MEIVQIVSGMWPRNTLSSLGSASEIEERTEADENYFSA